MAVKKPSGRFSQSSSSYFLILGVILGVLLGELNNLAILNQNFFCRDLNYEHVKQVNDDITKKAISNEKVEIESNENDLVLIGVMTAQKYLNSRVVAANRTWVPGIPGRVIFFSSEGSQSLPGVQVVALKGVDDSYPPQKKSFLMLKYMHEHYGDNYRFFMRADDDVYIRGDRLLIFLKSIDTSGNKSLFIGQTGLGNKDEFGALYLNDSDNFCMGGPAMILTPPTLAALAQHAHHCLHNLYTSHEDVEVGRCIQHHANVSCTWAYEVTPARFILQRWCKYNS